MTKDLRKKYEDEIRDAAEEHRESSAEDVNSYGAGYDGGYVEALRHKKDTYFAALDLIEKLEKALDAMAAQKREPEMSEEELENADFEFAYDCLVRTAREALADIKELEK